MRTEHGCDVGGRFTLESAQRAAETGELDRWGGDFLSRRGSNNGELGAGLARTPHRWIGPVRVSVTELVRIAGPEPTVEWPVEPGEWESEIAHMDQSLDRGWHPPPLIAQRRDGQLVLRDG